MPKEELFLTSAQKIGEDVRTVLTAYDTDGVRVTLHEDVLHRGVSAMVIIPAERYSADVRKRVEHLLVQAFDGEIMNFHLALGGGDQARLHFYLVARPGRFETIAVTELELSIGELIRSWSDRVRAGLERVRPPDEARRMARRYTEAFSQEYQAATSPAAAVQDIPRARGDAGRDRPVSVSFSNTARHFLGAGGGGGHRAQALSVGWAARPVRVHADPGERRAPRDRREPVPGEGGAVPKAIVYTFAVQDKAGQPLDVAGRATAIAETILAVRAGDASNDITNGLVLATGLHWRRWTCCGPIRPTPSSSGWYRPDSRSPPRCSGTPTSRACYSSCSR